MRFPDPAPPTTQYMGFSGGDGGGCLPPHPVNHKRPERPDSSISSYENPLLSKRTKIYSNNLPNSVPFQPIEPRVNLNPPSLPGSKGTCHIFYKTRLCAKFMESTCLSGERCTFAHGIEDLRKPPPNWKEFVQIKDKLAGNWTDEQRMIQGMKICKKFYSGEECPYGEKCNFLHERPPVLETGFWRQRESSAISLGTSGPLNGNICVSDQHLPEFNKNIDHLLEASRPRTLYWKTMICSKWVRGQCQYGELCSYAHGESDLQRPVANAEPEPALSSLQVPTKSLSPPVVDSSPATKVTGVPKAKVEEEKNISKWKLNMRVNQIYGDWLDDLSPPRSL